MSTIYLKKNWIEYLKEIFMRIKNNENFDIEEKIGLDNIQKIISIQEYLEVEKKLMEKEFLIFLLNYQKKLFLEGEEFFLCDYFETVLNYLLNHFRYTNENEKILFSFLENYFSEQFLVREIYFQILEKKLLIKIEIIFKNLENYNIQLLHLLKFLTKNKNLNCVQMLQNLLQYFYFIDIINLENYEINSQIFFPIFFAFILDVTLYLMSKNIDSVDSVHSIMNTSITIFQKNNLFIFLDKAKKISKFFYKILKIENFYQKIISENKINFMIEYFEEINKNREFIGIVKVLFIKSLKTKQYEKFSSIKTIIKSLKLFFSNKKNFNFIKENNFIFHFSIYIIILNFRFYFQTSYFDLLLEKLFKEMILFSTNFENVILNLFRQIEKNDFKEDEKIHFESFMVIFINTEEIKNLMFIKKVIQQKLLEINYITLKKKKYLEELLFGKNEDFGDILIILKNEEYIRQISQNGFNHLISGIQNFLDKNKSEEIFEKLIFFLLKIFKNKFFEQRISNCLKECLFLFDYAEKIQNDNLFNLLKIIIQKHHQEINKYSEFFLNKLKNQLLILSSKNNNSLLYNKIQILTLFKISIKKFEIENSDYIISSLIFLYDFSSKNKDEKISKIVIKIHSIFLKNNNLNNFMEEFFFKYFDENKKFIFENQFFQIQLLENIHINFNCERNQNIVFFSEIILSNIIFFYKLDFSNGLIERDLDERDFLNLVEIFQNCLSLNLNYNFLQNLLKNFGLVLKNILSNYNKNILFFHQITLLFAMIIHYNIDLPDLFFEETNFIFDVFFNFETNFFKNHFLKKISLICKITFLNFFIANQKAKNFYEKFLFFLNQIFEDFFELGDFEANRNFVQTIDGVERYLPLSQVNELKYFKSVLKELENMNYLDNYLILKKKQVFSFRFVKIQENIYQLKRILKIDCFKNKKEI